MFSDAAGVQAPLNFLLMINSCGLHTRAAYNRINTVTVHRIQ